MLDQVVNILNRFDFEIQNTSFDHITTSDEMSYLKLFELPNNEAADIIKYFPALFVMHREIDPRDGTFFIVLTDKEKSIPVKAQKIYKKFFPRRIMVVSGSADNLNAKWFHNSDRPEPLIPFIKKEVGVK